MKVEEWESRRRSVEMSHGRAHYVELGEGPPVILLHGVGITQGGHDWFRSAPLLAERFRVLAVDLVGWGRGDLLDQGYSFSRLVDFTRELQDRLGLAASHVVGHSMGGWVASLLAYESPERVDRLVLVGAGGAATRPLPMMTEFSPPSVAETVQGLVDRTGLSPAEVEPWAEYGFGAVDRPEAVESYRRVMAHMTHPETRSSYNMLRRYPYISAPTLALWGVDDPVNEIALAETVVDLIPDARLVALEQCGHFPASQRPEEFCRHVTAFLTS